MNGQAYSFIVLLILIPLLVFITGFLSVSQDVSTSRIDRIIADQMSQVAKNIEDDFVRAVQTTARRALLVEVNHILSTGEPIDNATLRMEELMVNGSIYGNASVIMFNNTIEFWRQKILATMTVFDRNISYYDIHVQNQDGFSVLVTIKLDINLSHQYNTSRISRTVIKEIPVSIEGLEDPLYILNSGGNVQKKVLRYPHSLYASKILTGTRLGNCTGTITFQEGAGSGKVLVIANASSRSGYEGSVSETTDLPLMNCYSTDNSNATAIVNETVILYNASTLTLDERTGVWILPISTGLQYYNMFSSSGPDYLKRLEGKLDASPNGLESFVMDATGIEIKPTQSRIDYHYFSNTTITGQAVRSFPSWFILDAPSAANYNLTELLE